MISKITKGSWLSRIFENLHYLGLVLVVALMIQGQTSTQISEAMLDTSVKRQGALRNLLWANLLAQRSAVFALGAALKSDPTLNERAIDVIKSVPGYFPENENQRTSEQKILLSQMDLIEKTLESTSAGKPAGPLPPKSPLISLMNQVDDLGTTLNSQEAKQWYSLLDQNSKLLKDLKDRKRHTIFTYILFIFYLGFLGWISYRKKVVEISLQQKTKELEEAQRAALLGAHQAGMAEVATGILHNIGNILNGVNISAEVIQRTAKNSCIGTFANANGFLRENQSKWGEFLLKDVKGSKLPTLYFSLEESLSSDLKALQTESTELLSKIQLIKDVINLQQNFTKGAEFKEEVSLQEISENVINMQLNSLTRHDVKVVKKFSDTSSILAQKAKLIHVLLNLIKNAKEAMSQVNGEKILTLEIGKSEEREIFIKVADTGVGVPQENLKKIFNHGFTTKTEGHGFGLHYCANAVTEMGGILTVHSEGEGKGTVFTINFKSAA